MEKFRYKTLEEIKSHLRHGDNVLISEMLEGIYSKKTVNAQLSGARTLKVPVIKAANRLIEHRRTLVESYQS